MKDMDTLMREQARLIILKALAAQVHEELNSDLVVSELEPFGIRKGRHFVHEEFAYLAEVGAVKVETIGTIQLARLTERGHRHLRREIALDGVKRPSRPGD